MFDRSLLAGVWLLVGVLPVCGQSLPARVWVDRDPERTEKILTRLRTERVDDAHFEDAPLSKVFEQFEAEHGISVWIDRVALDELGISEDEPISGKLNGLKLAVALDQVLIPLECGYTVRDGVLCITSRDSLLATKQLAIYSLEGFGDHRDRHDLADSIQKTIATKTWSPSGGTGRIAVIPSHQALLISQTIDVHEQIDAYLRALRELPLAENPEQPRQAARGGFGGGEFGGGYGGDFGGGFGGEYGGRGRSR